MGQPSKNLTRERLRQLLPRSSQAFLDLNAPDLAPFPSSAIEEHVEGRPLDEVLPAQAAGSQGTPRRFKVIFHVRAVQPCDWDNYHIKELQDLLVHAGVLPSDKWTVLQGEVIPEKVCSREEEGTLIEVLEQVAPTNGAGGEPGNRQADPGVSPR